MVELNCRVKLQRGAQDDHLHLDFTKEMETYSKYFECSGMVFKKEEFSIMHCG